MHDQTRPVRAPIERLIDRYVQERLNRGDIENITASSIGVGLRSFAHSYGARPIEQLGPRAVDRWLASTTDLADSTRRNRMSALKGFARWCVLHKVVERDFTSLAPRIRVARRVPRDLRLEDVERLLTVCRDERDRVLVWLAFGCGLRCIEIVRLKVADYDPLNRIVHVTGKAMHERVVPVPEPVRHAIDTYLKVHPFTTGHLVRSLAAGRGGRPISPSTVSHRIAHLMSDAGIKVHKYDGRSAHGLRAAAASDLYDACKDPRVVQEFLGHAYLQTTTIYLRRAGVERMREAQDSRTFRTTAPVAGEG